MKINEALKKYSLIPKRYEQKGKVYIVDTNLGKFVYKKSPPNKKILDYLKTRSFDYLAPYISDEDDYQITEYLDSLDIPAQQKATDLISLVSLLHSKTTHYKEIDKNKYEILYDDIKNNIAYLNGYYTDLITLIESKVYMSPSEYLLARNINMIFGALAFCEYKLEKWYDLIKEKTSERNVVLHNNLKLDHFIRNENSYLINWDKAKIDNPVFDIYKFYKNHALELDFNSILKTYETKYPFTKDEKELFYILISLPGILEFKGKEIDICRVIGEEIDTIYKTYEFTKKS